MPPKASDISAEYGAGLPGFRTPEDATRHWHRLRDDHIALLERLAAGSREFSADYSPESLMDLEAWYFKLHDGNDFGSPGADRAEFEVCMAMYLGETLVRNAGARWIVEEYPFVRGKYELGVRRGLVTKMLWRFTDHYRTPNNRRKESIYRAYRQLAR